MTRDHNEHCTQCHGRPLRAAATHPTPALYHPCAAAAPLMPLFICLEHDGTFSNPELPLITTLQLSIFTMIYDNCIDFFCVCVVAFSAAMAATVAWDKWSTHLQRDVDVR